jgi:ligand-binding SRPBCC domain-containing protein
VWERISSFEGVNDELRPLMRMTAPPEVRRLDPDTVPIGERICRSWVLLFGFLPFDYDDLTLVRLDPGRGFHERSRMLSQRVWEHERWIEPDGDAACLLRDRLTFEPRLGIPGGAVAPIVRGVFRHRHRRLRRRFGGRPVVD